MQFPAIARFPRLLFFLHSRRLTSSARCQATSMSSQQSKPLQKMHVAVLGAGAGGLVAARELLREGHQVTVFEKGSTVGGVWVYTDDVESDSLGLHPKRHRVHSSMYAGLRTNLPREVMAYSDFAFDDLGGKSEDARRFPSHKEVLNYLQAFATTFDLEKHITFNTQVLRAQPLFRAALPSNGSNGSNGSKAPAEPPTDLKEAAEQAQGIMPWPRWRLTTAPTSEAESSAPNAGTEAQQRRQQQEDAGAAQQLEFDAVVACSGHYSEPRVPLLLRSDARVLGPDDKLRGADVFPGRLMHSHNYRRPDEFAGKTVMLLGASSSGADICHEVAERASQVYLCARTYVSEAAPFGAKSNIWRRPPPLELHEDGRISFADGTTSEAVDTVMFCTGYRYSYPFLAPTDLVDVAENRVHPVYKHVFSINAAPTLAFIGLPFKVVPFPQMELVAKWIARVLSGRSQLPTMMAMRQDSRSHYEHLRMQGMPVRYMHLMDGDTQWRYNNWLAEQCGEEGEPLGAWRQQMYESTSENKRKHPEKYRDVFHYGQLPDAAQQETHEKQAAALRQTGMAA